MGWLPEGWLDIQPMAGAETAEPSLRQIVAIYYHLNGCRDSDALAGKYFAALSASFSPTPQPPLHAPQFPREEMGRIRQMLESRIGQDFEGECHLAEHEARAILALIPDQSERIARLEGALREIDELDFGLVGQIARSALAPPNSCIASGDVGAGVPPADGGG